jgi:hypothetical protein
MYRTRLPTAFSCSNAGDCVRLLVPKDSPRDFDSGVAVDDEELLGTPSLETSKAVLPSEK